MIELHHRIAGDGPPLLLGHSLGTTLAMWDPNVDALASAARVVRFDLRGHGGSGWHPGPYRIADLAADVLALMDRLKIARASYCGTSLGGMVGTWLAANAPDRIDRLTLICSSAHLPPASRWTERAAAVRRSGGTKTIAEAVVARWLTPTYAADHPTQVADLRAMLLATPAEGYAGCCEAIARMDMRDELGRITAPTLVIAGAEDHAIPAAHGRRLADAIPDARLEVLPQAAHLASVERTDDINRLVLDHLQGVTA